MQSPLYYEIVAALNSPTTTVIPVRMPSFRFPKEADLWPEIKGLRMMNAVSYVHEYQHAAFDKIEWFIRGEVFAKENSSLAVPTSFNSGSGFFSSKSRQSSNQDLTKIKA